MTGNHYDAIVVGPRCAGSPTAMLLARTGHRVVIVDRATFLSDTISTHLVHPPGVATLRDGTCSTGSQQRDLRQSTRTHSTSTPSRSSELRDQRGPHHVRPSADRAVDTLLVDAASRLEPKFERRSRPSPLTPHDALSHAASIYAFNTTPCGLKHRTVRRGCDPIVICSLAPTGALLPTQNQLLLRALFTDTPLPYAEVAHATGIPPGSLGPTTRARALQQLRHKLNEHELKPELSDDDRRQPIPDARGCENRGECRRSGRVDLVVAWAGRPGRRSGDVRGRVRPVTRPVGSGTGPRRTRPEIGPALSSHNCALS